MPFAVAGAYLLQDAAAFAGLLLLQRWIFLRQIRKDTWRWLLCALILPLPAVSLLFVLPRYPDYDGFVDAISFGVMIGLSFLVLEKPKLLQLLGQTLVYMSTVEVLWALLATYLPRTLLLETLCCAVLYAAVGVLFRIAGGHSRINVLPKLFASIPKWIFFVLVFFEWMCYYKLYGESAARFDALFVLSSVALLGSVGYLIGKILYLSNRQNAILQQLSAQKEYQESKITDDEELRRFRHDYRNHMTVMHLLLENGKVQEAQNYLESMSEGVYAIIHKMHTGNFVADALLNVKAVAAAKDGVTVRCFGNIPADGIRDDDLCTVLGNLLDNAVEASRQVKPDKCVTVEARTQGQHFILSVSNPTAAAPRMQNGVLQTTKADKKNHGYGLRNVSRTAKKYGGAVTTNHADGTFSVDVMLNLPKHSPESAD